MSEQIWINFWFDWCNYRVRNTLRVISIVFIASYDLCQALWVTFGSWGFFLKRLISRLVKLNSNELTQFIVKGPPFNFTRKSVHQNFWASIYLYCHFCKTCFKTSSLPYCSSHSISKKLDLFFELVYSLFLEVDENSNHYYQELINEIRSIR